VRCCVRGDGLAVPNDPLQQFQGPEGIALSGPFVFHGGVVLKITRDWAAVMAAAALVALIKLGWLPHIPW
jgi:hypothetical protein